MNTWTPPQKPIGAINTKLQLGSYAALTLLEAGIAAYCMARIVLGPVSQFAYPSLWLLWAITALTVFCGMSLCIILPLLSGDLRGISHGIPLWMADIPVLVILSAELIVLQLRPDLGSWPWHLFSPLEPFPSVGMLLGVLLLFLLKLLAVTFLLHGKSPVKHRIYAGSADVAVPLAMLLIGILQASVYLVPLGDLFPRVWAVADAIASGISYPVTITEAPTVIAGGPPYIYDLPLSPLLLRAAFALVGHNSAAAHLPSFLASVLFPLSIYLLLRTAIGSRLTALVFATLASLFPYLRFWVLNLPDPDPLLLTGVCLAAHTYLRALNGRERPRRWAIAGIASGLLSLTRPEGILYAGCLAVGMVASRPKRRLLAVYILSFAAVLVPMSAVWMVNFGFLWPQNYNGTLRWDHPIQNYDILRGADALGFYQRGLGLDAPWALAFLVLCFVAVLLGVVAMAFKGRQLLALAVSGIGNSVAVFFISPAVTNTSHFADFFRHASFGLPFLLLTAAYGLHTSFHRLASRRPFAIARHVGLVLLILIVAREGDILANPTATHRPGSTQVLTDNGYLSIQTVLEHPMPLPAMTYYREGRLEIAYPVSMAWPEDAIAFFRPLDMTFDDRARPFGYASVVAFLLALGFALLAEPGLTNSGLQSSRPR